MANGLIRVLLQFGNVRQAKMDNENIRRQREKN